MVRKYQTFCATVPATVPDLRNRSQKVYLCIYK